MAKVKLSIVIPSYNTSKLLQRCIDSVYRSKIPFDFEVVVVDNGSTDGSVEETQRCYPSVLLIKNSKNLGFAAASNQGIEKSSGSFILFLNSDCELFENTVSEMASFLDKEKGAGMVGAQMVFPDGSYQNSLNCMMSLSLEIFSPLARLRLFFARRRCRQCLAFEAENLFGACIMVRRQALEEAGAFDERYFFYHEDTDLAIRFTRAGWRLFFLPDVKVIHVRGASTRIKSEQVLNFYKGKYIFFEKFYGVGAARFLKVYHYITALLKMSFYLLLRFLSLLRYKRADEKFSFYLEAIRCIRRA